VVELFEFPLMLMWRKTPPKWADAKSAPSLFGVNLNTVAESAFVVSFFCFVELKE
jgi:hypothetical protein